MKLRKQSGVVLALATLVAIVLPGGTANAQSYRVIHNFQGSLDGWEPFGVPAIAKNGDLYGVTVGGGKNDLGTVFKLAAPRNRGGAWTKTVLYNFTHQDPGYPTSLIIGEDGTLYGAGNGLNTRGFIFRMTPPAPGKRSWHYEVLYQLATESEGSTIYNLTLDAAGNLYDSAEQGGDMNCSCGTVFELKRPVQKGGQWIFSVLYTFMGGADGDEPFAGVTFDQNGDLYGTTNWGGTLGSGAVYRLTPPATKRQPWTEAVLYSFAQDGPMGSHPGGPVTFDASGNMYGTTAFGGDLNCSGGFGCGVVFQLTEAGETWTYTNLYSFQCGSDGANPAGYMVVDNKGNLYSTTTVCGGGSDAGSAFKLTPPSQNGDPWTETVLHRFVAPAGAGAVGGLVWGKWNDLYGVTYLGGTGCPTQGCGTVFELRP
jgi:uncharacterized repeat protein (TIGR03803 family)